jgi:drug/metabolite transporter (DMT)-like permease
VTSHLFAACIVFAMSLGAGQLLFKLAAGDIKQRLAAGWIEALLSPWLISALVLYAASTALWLYILSHLPLTRAYPFTLLGATLVPLLAWLVLREPLPSLYVLGMAVVIAGLAIIQLS